MAEKALSLCRNDVMGGGMMSNTGQCTSSSIRNNRDVGDRFRVLGGGTGLNSSVYWNINGWDSSNNASGGGDRGGNLFSAKNQDTAVYYHSNAVKYGRSWGCQIGYKNKPHPNAEYNYLHAVCGLEFNWATANGDKNNSYCNHLILLYGSGYDSVYAMPLINDGKAYPGATSNHSGDNLLDINKNSSSGKICIRGSSSDCGTIQHNDLIFLGLAIAFKQRGNQTVGKDQQFWMWNCRPMFSRDGISSGYRAICPGKKYPWSEALDGYMAIA